MITKYECKRCGSPAIVGPDSGTIMCTTSMMFLDDKDVRISRPALNIKGETIKMQADKNKEKQ